MVTLVRLWHRYDHILALVQLDWLVCGNRMSARCLVLALSSRGPCKYQHVHTMQEYQEQAREARRAAREDARQAAEEGNHIDPLSGVAQRRLRLDTPHELPGHVRPGVMSRFPHTLKDYQSTIEEMQVCLLTPSRALVTVTGAAGLYPVRSELHAVLCVLASTHPLYRCHKRPSVCLAPF